jgi:two-component system, chemotaxis family, chemotaxis protein CheY
MIPNLAKKFAGFRVIVVDDISSARWSSKLLLKNIGFSLIDEAKSGREALDKLKSGEYHLIVSDWSMADMDGLALFKELSADPRLRRIPFVLVTGSLNKDNMSSVATSGVHSAIAKPVTEETLKSAVISALTKVARIQA